MKRILTHTAQMAATLIAAVLLQACSATDEPSAPEVTKPAASPYILFGSAPVAMDWMVAVGSREGSSTVPTVKPLTMGVWGFNDYVGQSYTGAGVLFRNTPVFNLQTNRDEAEQTGGVSTTWQDDYSNNWGYIVLSNPNPQLPMPWMVSTAETPVNYRFYAYAPYMASAKSPVESFYAFDRVNLVELPRVSAIDYMVADNILTYRAKTNPTQNTVQTFPMKHLYARLRFRFKLGERYSAMRTVILKSMEIVDLPGQTVSMTIQFNYNEATSSYDAPDYTWGRDEEIGKYDHVDLQPDGDTELTLNKEEYQPYASVYLYPRDNFAIVKIRVTYDVYDDHGQLLRRDDTATSALTLNLLASNGTPGGKYLDSGYCHDVNVLVAPAFLYVLSDNDMGSDGRLVIAPDAP